MATILTPGIDSRFNGLITWLRSPHLARRLGIILTIAAALSSFATYVGLSGSLEGAVDPEWVLALLYLDVILLLLLAVVIARRLVQIMLARRQDSAGSRLHARLVGLFSIVAVAPAIVVAVFALSFLHYGLETWFGDSVTKALTNSLTVAESYLEEHKEDIGVDALNMAADIDREAPNLLVLPDAFQRFFDRQAVVRSLNEAIVFRGDGRVIARTGLSFALEIENLPHADQLARAAGGEALVLTNETGDRVRALVGLRSFDNTFLYVGRFVDSRVLGYLDETRRVVDEYRSKELGRDRFERTFAIIFGLITLLLLLAAVVVGLIFANNVAGRISALIHATDQVRAGDLTFQMPEAEELDEISQLQSAFNRMTAQLNSQRNDLMAANSQIDQRRLFTEAVLGGVSSGVIGLDAQGRITLPNAAAIGFLGADDALFGRPIIALLPEIAGLLASVVAAPHAPALEEQIEFRRQDGHRTLLVKIVAQLDDEQRIAGFVLTFDDITELLSAQRTAAWSEVARRIAHEIKNPLTPIRLSAERLKRKYLPQIDNDQETFVGSVDTIVRQVDNIGRLINEFSAFARMPAPVFNHDSACDLVRQAVYLQQGARSEIRFLTELPDEDLQLYCDSRKVTQALTNLVQNSVQSVLQRLKQEGEDGGHGWVLVKLDEIDQFCMIEVRDNGLGLPADEPADRLTEPYVTKRADGTGLGLAIVKKIMEEHGGTISLRNRDEGGACVTLAFPMLPAAGNAAAE